MRETLGGKADLDWLRGRQPPARHRLAAFRAGRLRSGFRPTRPFPPGDPWRAWPRCVSTRPRWTWSRPWPLARQRLLWPLAAMLAFLLALTIGNTVRMAFARRREEVEIMRLVGAREWTIRLPLVSGAATLGASLGALAGLGLLKLTQAGRGRRPQRASPVARHRISCPLHTPPWLSWRRRPWSGPWPAAWRREAENTSVFSITPHPFHAPCRPHPQGRPGRTRYETRTWNRRSSWPPTARAIPGPWPPWPPSRGHGGGGLSGLGGGNRPHGRAQARAGGGFRRGQARGRAAFASRLGQGLRRVVVQSLHVVPGEEYHEMLASLGRYLENGGDAACGLGRRAAVSPTSPTWSGWPRRCWRPISDDRRGRDEALVHHGPRRPAARSRLLRRPGRTAHPPRPPWSISGPCPGSAARPVRTSLRIRDALARRPGGRTAWLMPFFTVAGAHACTDLAGDGPTSWRGRLEAAGITCRPVLAGLIERRGLRGRMAGTPGPGHGQARTEGYGSFGLSPRPRSTSRSTSQSASPRAAAIFLSMAPRGRACRASNWATAAAELPQARGQLLPAHAAMLPPGPHQGQPAPGTATALPWVARVLPSVMSFPASYSPRPVPGRGQKRRQRPPFLPVEVHGVAVAPATSARPLRCPALVRKANNGW